MVLATAFGMLFAALGGQAAARLAPHREWAARLMTGLMALDAAVSLVASPTEDARWSQWCALLLMAPCAYLGARLARRGRSATA